ncbi:MAG: cobaltochelatase subunit CobN [Oscillospiraceae bacterium]|nr:cobaltochelatase subunit CobN [Oscillospiraceae bacterium]
MRVLIIGKPHHSEAVRRAAMHEGIELCCISSADARKKPHGEKYDFILVGSDHGAKEPLSGCAIIDGKTPTAALDAMNIAAGVGNVPKKEASDITACFAYGGRQNFENAFRIIKSLLGEETWETSAPKSVPLDSIFTEEGKFYSSALEFFEGEGRKYPVYVGILFHRSKWINDNYSPELAISKALNRRNIGTILAFTNNAPDKEIDSLGFDETVRRAFTDCGKPVIELLVNFQFFGSRAQKGQDMFSTSA